MTSIPETTGDADLRDAVNLILPHPADILRSIPGRWGRVSEHLTAGNAAKAATVIRHGKYGRWAPRGDFEATWHAEDDYFVVYARYVGQDGQR